LPSDARPYFYAHRPSISNADSHNQDKRNYLRRYDSWAKASAISCALPLVLLVACEGSAPSFYAINSKDSKLTGQAMLDMACIRYNSYGGNCVGYGTSIEVQFENLHNSRPYIALLRKGKCSEQQASVISRVRLRIIEFEPSEGALADFALVDQPIHWFIQDRHSVALYDLRSKQIAACGDLTH